MRHLYYITLFSFLIAISAQGQDKKEQQAAKKYDDYAYIDAIESYESLLAKGYSSEEIYKRLGNANYLTANYKTASQWYSKLFELENANIEPEYLYKYAQTLKSLEQYEISDQWMSKFEAAKSGDHRALKYSQNRDYLATIQSKSGRYTIQNMEINSSASDFAPSYYGNALVFSTARDTSLTAKNTDVWNRAPFLNLFVAHQDTSSTGYDTPINLSRVLNTKTHESSTAFTKDGKTVYFTRNNSKHRTFARDKEGVSRLKIYRASLAEGVWKNITELPFNDDSYSVAHPTLSPDEDKLYFSSNMPGSLGASDIFEVSIHSDGSYGTPKNLGDQINTESRETFPFVTSDNVLYFASDGYPGLGGLDVYATKLDDLKNAYVVNVGSPINTEEDDFSFVLDEASNTGFFASNRSGGKGSDDLYSVVEQKPPNLGCTKTVNGTVKDKETGLPLDAAKVSLFNSDKELIMETTSETDGSFSLVQPCKTGRYTVVWVKYEYDTGSTQYTSRKEENPMRIELVLSRTVKLIPAASDTALSRNVNMTDASASDKTLSRNVNMTDAGASDKTLSRNVNMTDAGASDKTLSRNVNMTDVGASDKTLSRNVKMTDASASDKTLSRSLKLAAVGNNLVTFLGLSPIHFDSDSAEIRSVDEATLGQVIAYLKMNLVTRIEVQSHTDSKASEAYNLNLSKRRATSTIAYLVSKGIAKERLTSKGLGEYQLLNRCTSDTECPEAEHLRNRRSEFIVVE